MQTAIALADLATVLAYSVKPYSNTQTFSVDAARNIATLVRTGVDALFAHGLTDEQVAVKVPALTSHAIEFLTAKAEA